jgi:hypothetical protein
MTNTFKLMVAALLLVTGSIGTAVADDSMSCGTHIISSGQDESPGMYEVLKRCGEPTYRQGNTWVYEKSGLAHKIRFDSNGNILDIN